MGTLRILPRLFLLLALVGCGGGGSSGPSNANTQFLIDHNARFNDGVTTRWPNLPIRVFANNIAQQAEVTEWTAVTGGLITFSFVGSRSAADITFDFGGGADICGEAAVEFESDGRIVSAEIRVVQAVFRGPQCVRTVTHETAHALGFLDHTADGTLMDPDGGNGEISGAVAQFFRDLYSMPPGTVIVSQGRRAVQRRPGGRYVITIVDPVRR